LEGRFAGLVIGGGGRDSEADARERMESLASWFRGEDVVEGRKSSRWRRITERDLLAGTSLTLTGGKQGTGFGSLWGRGVLSRFDGDDDEMTLSGEVLSGMLGVDWWGERGTAGMLLAHSRGEGDYRSPQGNGALESSLTGFYPYGRYALSERLSVWGVAGYGKGELQLAPAGADTAKTDMDLFMAAAGGRGVVWMPASGGPELAVKADGLLAHTGSNAEPGELVAANAAVTRLRAGIEGTWRVGEAEGGQLVPSLEVGVRYDGGDAETGFGADIGAGVAWSDPARGLAVDLRGRTLVTHEDGTFREFGIAGSVSWDRDPSSDLGPTLSMRQTLGSRADGGMDALLSRGAIEALAAEDNGADLRPRFEARLGYGLPVFGHRFTGTPEVGIALSETMREYGLGWRLSLVTRSAAGFALRLEGTQHEPVRGDRRPEHRVGLRLNAHW